MDMFAQCGVTPKDDPRPGIAELKVSVWGQSKGIG
jgi:hypothetical protein